MMRCLPVLSLILLFALAAAVHPAAASGNGSVAVAPASSSVGVGGTVNIDVVIDPPSSELSVYIVKVAYDPNVVEVTGCTFLTAPPGFVGAAGCDTQDTNADLIDDTAVAFGGFIKNVGGTPHGFNSPQIVATFSFQAVGAPSQQSPLSGSVLAFLGPNGETNTPSINNGTIHIVNAPSVTAAPTPTVAPALTVAPVGGSVELLSATEGRTFASSEPMLALAIGALFAAGCIAFVASRRIIGR